jgi:transposase
MKRIPRRTFTVEFKAEVIKLVTEQTLTRIDVSRKLDIATHPRRTWIAQQARGTLKASLGADKLMPDQLRIRELERELAIAKMGRDILMALCHPEKTTAFFAKESK